jgi:hypothetical protein
MPNQPQQPRFPSVQPRVTNPSTAMITNQATVRLHDPQKFNQRRLPFSFSFFEFTFKKQNLYFSSFTEFNDICTNTGEYPNNRFTSKLYISITTIN